MKDNIKIGDTVYFYEKSYNAVCRGIVSLINENTIEVNSVCRRISEDKDFCPLFGTYEKDIKSVFKSEEEVWNTRMQQAMLEK